MKDVWRSRIEKIIYEEDTDEYILGVAYAMIWEWRRLNGKPSINPSPEEE